MQNAEFRMQNTDNRRQKADSRGQNLRFKIATMLMITGLICAGQLVSPNKIDAYPYAYAAIHYRHTVSVIDVATNQYISTIPVGSFPQEVAITPDGRYVYVTNSSSNNVSAIDITTNQVIATIPVGNNPYGVAITHDSRYAYVTNYGSNDVSVIDTTTKQVIATVTVGSAPFGVALTPDGRYAYMTNGGSNTVSVIDITTKQVIATIPVGSSHGEVAITHDSRYAYVTNGGSNTVSVIDITTKQVIVTIPVGSSPRGVAITPDDNFAYVTNNDSDTVSVIDITTNQVIATITVEWGPYKVAITPDSRYVYVTAWKAGYFSRISVIDITTNQVIAIIPCESQARGIAITPTPPTLVNTQIINGTDTGALNEADTPGDVILSYTSTMGNGTITCNQVITIVEQVYGLSHLPQPADKSGTYGTTIHYTYCIRNTGNGTDTITLTPGNSWASTIIQDDNQDGVRQGTETTAITQLTLAANQFNYFFLAVQIPATATTGQQSTTTLTASAQNGVGADDNWGYPDTRTDEVVTLCSVGMPAVITITKARDKQQVRPGGTITYTLTYRNNTGSPATDITIIDAVPSNTVLVEPATGTDTTVEYYVSGAWTTTFSTTATKVKWTRTTPLSAVSEATVRFTVQVK